LSPVSRDAESAARSIAEAETLLAQDSSPLPPPGPGMSELLVRRWEARCWAELEPARGVALYDDIMRDWPRGWTRDGVQLKRELACDDSQHAALTERIKVAADTLHIRPSIRRLDGHTQILLGDRDAEAITDGEVTLAARIEDFYRTVVGIP